MGMFETCFDEGIMPNNNTISRCWVGYCKIV